MHTFDEMSELDYLLSILSIQSLPVYHRPTYSLLSAFFCVSEFIFQAFLLRETRDKGGLTYDNGSV